MVCQLVHLFLTVPQQINTTNDAQMSEMDYSFKVLSGNTMKFRKRDKTRFIDTRNIPPTFSVYLVLCGIEFPYQTNTTLAV